MSTAGAARLLAAGAAWRLTGARPAGRSLVAGLVTGDEAERAVAGISLTKAATVRCRCSPPPSARLREPEPVVDVLASIGTPAARSALRQAADADSPAAGPAARALRTLDDIEGL